MRVPQFLNAVAIPFLVVAWIYSFYGALFCLWMLAHPLYTGEVWKWRLGYWLTGIAAITAATTARIIQSVRRRRRRLRPSA